MHHGVTARPQALPAVQDVCELAVGEEEALAVGAVIPSNSKLLVLGYGVVPLSPTLFPLAPGHRLVPGYCAPPGVVALEAGKLPKLQWAGLLFLQLLLLLEVMRFQVGDGEGAELFLYCK